MLGIFQHRLYFAIMVLATIIIAAGIAYRGLDLGNSPRPYAQIIATPTPTRGPDTPTLVIRTIPAPPRTLTTPPLAFMDNFTGTNNFVLVPNVHARTTITNSGLFVHFLQPTTAYLLSHSTQARSDFTVQVDGRAVTFSRSEYGLLFWHGVESKTRAEQFIFFLVNPIGSFRVTAWNKQKGESEIVSRTFSNAIRTGTLTNTLSLDARTNHLTFRVNGVIVANAGNDSLAGYTSGLEADGKVGLIGTSEFGNLDIQFSNFRLYAQP
jgi:hypothetical protein